MRHSTIQNGKRLIWDTRRLWTLTKDLVPFEKKLDEIAEIDWDCWFGEGYEPTVRAVTSHAKRMMEADLSYPIIFNADGSLMDGGHRIGKAMIEGRRTIMAVQFTAMPEPDEIIDWRR